MTNFPPPSPPFIKARFHGGAQTPKAIVLHGTVTSDNKGTARNVANWWAGPTSPKSSAQYVVDPGEVIQCVGDHTVAYHCGFNTGSIAVEFCDEQTGPASRWQDADSKAILRRGARLVAELCLAYGISPERPSIADLKRKGPHGIYGHNDSRLAFGHTTHTDPREFPWAQFLGLVRTEIAAIRNEVTPVKPKRGGQVHTLTNVGRGNIAAQRRAIPAVKQRHKNALHGLIEIGEADGSINEPWIVKNTFPDPWRRVGISKKHPIVAKLGKSWKFIGGETIFAVGGQARSWPNRYFTVVKYQKRLNPKNKLARVNTHFAPGAFNNKIEHNQALRLAAWNEHWEGLRELIKELRQDGFDVVVSGDFNRQGKFPHLHRAAILVAHESVDRIYAIPAKGRKAEVRDSGTAPIGVDFHKHIWVKVKFSNA